MNSAHLCNGMIGAGMSCQVIHYVHEEHDKFFDVVKNFDALIVRCNPGQIKADGGSQEKFDEGMRAMLKAGKQGAKTPVIFFVGKNAKVNPLTACCIGAYSEDSVERLKGGNNVCQWKDHNVPHLHLHAPLETRHPVPTARLSRGPRGTLCANKLITHIRPIVVHLQARRTCRTAAGRNPATALTSAARHPRSGDNARPGRLGAEAALPAAEDGD